MLDVGPQFFLLALVSDRIRFDGFECFRINDVKKLRPDPYAPFAKAALKKRRERRPKKPRVSLANIEELLLSAGKAFPLITRMPYTSWAVNPHSPQSHARKAETPRGALTGAADIRFFPTTRFEMLPWRSVQGLPPSGRS